jgi:VCBS repeat-containing protein
MPDNLSGGTTVSFNNTPQAKDDFFGLDEDVGLKFFDVLANDLGGNAKTLWSIDNTSDDGFLDLASKDLVGASEFSELGARIYLTSDGRIAYDTSIFNSLAAGKVVVDQFTYAIRLSNGTLSWATVNVTLTGTNDGPVAVADTGTAGENEAKSFNVLANDTDVDTGDTKALSSLGLITVNGVAATAAQAAAFSIVNGQIQFTPGTAYDYLGA